MKLTGTILGFLLGFIFGHNIVVAVVCALIGYFVFDKPRLEKNEKRQKAYNAFSKGANYNLALVDITFSFMGYIARGAGRINEEHIGSAYSVMEMMQLDENARKTAMTAFNAGKQPDFNIDAKVAELKAIIGDNDAFVDYILEIQIQVALSDGVLAKQEHDRLIILAASLGVSVQSMERLITIRYSEMMFLSVLETPDTTISRAHRKIIRMTVTHRMRVAMEKATLKMRAVPTMATTQVSPSLMLRTRFRY